MTQPTASPQPPDSTPDAARQAPKPGQRSRASQPKSRRTSPASGAPAPRQRVRVDSPAALLAVVPALLTFQPARSVVVIGTGKPRAQVRVTLRYDLPDPSDAEQATALVSHVLSVLAAQRITSAVAVGYGPDELVSPVAVALLANAPAAGVTVTEFLRAEHQRYWSYTCDNPSCCSPQGTPFDVAGHPAARAMAMRGTQVLASRADLAATVAPADGELAAAMHAATTAVERQFAASARLAKAGQPVSVGRMAAAIGVPAVREAILRYRAGEAIGPEYAALLTVALRQGRVRDDAWAHMIPAHRSAHQRLWTDLTRLASPGYVAAPAALLAFVAWQQGNGALANVALDRALTDNPRYSMAMLLRQAIDAGAPPSLARLPMTPEEVAAYYDGTEADGDEDHAGGIGLGESDDRQVG